MTPNRKRDGSAGDVDYGAIGGRYAEYRQPDPTIAAHILSALGDARTVVNVGAGAGSYEPTDRNVVAVEPSATMRSQRPAHLTTAVDAVAESLPFADGAFAGALATSTVHQWRDLAAGLTELKRVTRGPIVLLVSDPDRLHDFWVADYVPEALDVERARFPRIATLLAQLGEGAFVEHVPIPLMCTDGFTEAYYGRPERLLEPGVIGAMSSWMLVDPAVVAQGLEHLRDDLACGAWDQRFHHLRAQATYDGSLRLIVRP